MNDTEITAIAREYAEEEGKHDIEQGFGEAFAKDMLEFNEKEFKSVLEFLLRRYALVEKEKVRRQFEYAKGLLDDQDYNKQCIGVGSRGILNRLFPEIEKEVKDHGK